MKVCAGVTASIANKGPGFDAFAVAPRESHEFVIAATTHSDTPSLEILPGGCYDLPSNSEENNAGVSSKSYLKAHGLSGHFTIEIEKTIKPCEGLGSSDASAVGVLYALIRIYGKNSMEELICYASAREVVSSGTVHHHNTPASRFGMFVVNDGSNFAKCNVPEIPFVIAVQDIDLATSASRSDLEGTVSIRDHGCHISASVLLLDSIFRSDLQSIGKYVNMENVVDRRRSDLIIGFNEVKKSALPAGTYVVSISGSAPSLFAVTSKETCNDVASDMVYAFSDNGVSASNIIANSSSSGAVMIH